MALPKRVSVSIVIAAAAAVAVLAARPAALDDTPPPRGPVIPRITSVDQLVPWAKIVIQRDFIGQRHGWAVRGGEKVLYETTTAQHPMVREAFIKALKDMGCSVDVVILDRAGGDGETTWSRDAVKRVKERLALDFNKRPPDDPPRGITTSAAEAKNYDIVMGRRNPIGGLGGTDAWESPEVLANVGTAYPGEIMDVIDAKAWAILRNAERVEISDLQGSQASFTWWPEWWEIIEGRHPTIKSAGSNSTFGALRPGRSEYADFAGHLAGVPRFGAIERTDFKGTLVATNGQGEMVPRLTLHMANGEIQKIEGGGDYGDMWRDVLALTADIQYPGFARPGTAWIVEFAIGTNPKIIGPTDIEELKGVPGRDLSKLRWPYSRDRAGIVHAGFGVHSGATWWAELMRMPVNHYHMRLYYVTYTAHLRNGSAAKLLDKGNLTVLNDPEVRAVAAKYGDPDKLLSVDWIPELSPEGELRVPKGRLVSYEEYMANLPYKLDDPRLVYRRPKHLEAFYSEDRMKYYNPEEYMEFYRKLGQIPVKRVPRKQ
jgi:hypothetical protein